MHIGARDGMEYNSDVVTATVEDASGNNVTDGTVVTFTVDSLASVNPVTNTTASGVATTTLTTGSVAGTAVVTATADSVTDTANVTITAAEQPTPTPVPTLSEWGMFILVGLVALYAVWGLRRRRVGT